MNADIISSTQNARIKRLLLLQQKSSERRRSGRFVVEGRRELEHCIEAGMDIEEVFVCRQLNESLPSLYRLSQSPSPLSSLPPHSPVITEVSPNVYERIAYRGSTEGVVAVVRQRPLTLADLPPLTPHHKSPTPHPSPLTTNLPPLTPHPSPQGSPLLVVLESVEKPGNIGAVLRSADAAGATAVIVCDPLTDLYNPNLIRASIGAFFTVPLVACTSQECIRFLKDNGIAILTAQLQDSHLYYDTDMRRPVAIVMGTEADGLTTVWREAADAHIRIPMLGRLDSLNVSVSAAILLFEAVRQRQPQQ